MCCIFPQDIVDFNEKLRVIFSLCQLCDCQFLIFFTEAFLFMDFSQIPSIWVVFSSLQKILYILVNVFQ